MEITRETKLLLEEYSYNSSFDISRENFTDEEFELLWMSRHITYDDKDFCDRLKIDLCKLGGVITPYEMFNVQNILG